MPLCSERNCDAQPGGRWETEFAVKVTAVSTDRILNPKPSDDPSHPHMVHVIGYFELSHVLLSDGRHSQKSKKQHTLNARG